VCVQARQVLEREFNNLLALGTERNLAEVNFITSIIVGQSIVMSVFVCPSVSTTCCRSPLNATLLRFVLSGPMFDKLRQA